MKIEDKFTYNDDYYFIKLFKIVYIITRLEREIIKYIFFK